MAEMGSYPKSATVRNDFQMHQVASLLRFCGSRGIRYLGPRLSRTATRSAGVPFRHPVMLGVLFWFIRKWRRRLRFERVVPMVDLDFQGMGSFDPMKG